MSKINKDQNQSLENDAQMADKKPLTQLSKEPLKASAQDPMQESNPLHALEKQNKVKEKQDAAEEAMKTRCKVCFKETSPQRKCLGHGGGGGGSGESKSGSITEASVTPTFASSPTDSKSTSAELFSGSLIDAMPSSGKELEEELSFDLELMLELLSFTNDDGKGIFTIRAKPGYSLKEEKEMQKYLDAINSVFEQFKNELKKEGILVENFTSTTNKNELVIRIPSPKYYDAFIQKLIAKHLLPALSEKLENKEQELESSPSPFAKTPSPSPSKTDDLEDERTQSSFSPFSIELKPKLTQKNNVD